MRIYTRNGAYASFEEGQKGSIEVGKLADLVVLESDPTAIDPFGIKDITVARTILGGRTVTRPDAVNSASTSEIRAL